MLISSVADAAQETEENHCEGRHVDDLNSLEIIQAGMAGILLWLSYKSVPCGCRAAQNRFHHCTFLDPSTLGMHA